MKTKILLEEEQMPKKWYNVQADLPSPMDPPLHPATHKPVMPDDLKAIFPMELIRQEVTTDRYIDIPEEVQEVLHLWRPSPLYRAHRLMSGRVERWIHRRWQVCLDIIPLLWHLLFFEQDLRLHTKYFTLYKYIHCGTHLTNCVCFCTFF